MKPITTAYDRSQGINSIKNCSRKKKKINYSKTSKDLLHQKLIKDLTILLIQFDLNSGDP